MNAQVQETRSMILVLGEVLIDRFPNYQRIGGAPLNFACHLHHLGETVRLMSRIGDDADGRRICAHLQARGLATDDVQIDRRYPTGRVDVTLDSEGGPVFTILEPVAYDFIDLRQAVDEDPLMATELIYYGTLAQRSAHGAKQIGALLDRCPTPVLCFCDINLREPHYDVETVIRSLQRADILKLNEDEIEIIARMLALGSNSADIPERIMTTYQIEFLAVTRGAQGAIVFGGGQRFDSPSPPDIAVRDTVGAGDAFAAVMAWGILHKLPMPRVLAAATHFAARICALPGAIPDDPAVYDEILTQLGQIQ
jgi:fructokinase